MIKFAARLMLAETMAALLGTFAGAIVLGIGGPVVLAAGVGLACKARVFFDVLEFTR